MNLFLHLVSKSLRLIALACGLLGCTFAWAATPAAGSGALPVGLAPALGQTLAAQLPATWQARPVGGGAVFSNPAQHLRAQFDSRGLHLSKPGQAPMVLRLMGYRQGSAQAALHTYSPVLDGTRVSRDWGAGLSEWYVNSPLGIEQGFTLVHPLNTNRAVALSFVLQGDRKSVV